MREVKYPVNMICTKCKAKVWWFPHRGERDDQYHSKCGGPLRPLTAEDKRELERMRNFDEGG